MPQYKAGSVTRNGVEVPIFVDDYGRWGANYAGSELRADTRDKLADAIGRATKQTAARVSVPFVMTTDNNTSYSEGIAVKRGVATGRHSANGNILVTWTARGKETREQLTFSYNSVFLPGDMTDEQLEEFHQLSAAKSRANRAHADFVRKHQIDLNKEVDKALDEATRDD